MGDLQRILHHGCNFFCTVLSSERGGDSGGVHGLDERDSHVVP
jgi:hypothetical protein